MSEHLTSLVRNLGDSTMITNETQTETDNLIESLIAENASLYAELDKVKSERQSYKSLCVKYMKALQSIQDVTTAQLS